MEKTEFIRCPVCGNKTRDKIREDTILNSHARTLGTTINETVQAIGY